MLLTLNFLSAQAAGPRIRNATACFSVVPGLVPLVTFRCYSVRKPEGRLCECWKFFPLPNSTGITKKKKLSFFYESSASNPIWAWPDKFSSNLLGLLFQPDNPIIGEACQCKQLTFNFLSAQAAVSRKLFWPGQVCPRKRDQQLK